MALLHCWHPGRNRLWWCLWCSRWTEQLMDVVEILPLKCMNRMFNCLIFKATIVFVTPDMHLLFLAVYFEINKWGVVLKNWGGCFSVLVALVDGTLSSFHLEWGGPGSILAGGLLWIIHTNGKRHSTWQAYFLPRHSEQELRAVI